mgnify:CR=1 FL=1
MATTTTTKKATTAATNTATSTVEDKKTTELEDKVKSLTERLAKMQELMSSMMATPVAQPAKTNENRLIRFINLSTGKIVLKGSTTWVIDKQFDYRDFLETEASIIVANMPKTIAQGLVYIADADFVASHNLAEVYRHILDDNTLETLFDKDYKHVVDLFKSCSDAQKLIIFDMVNDRLEQGIDVDANIVAQIEKLSGKKFVREGD